MTDRRDPPPRTPRTQLKNQIDSLTDAVQTLRAQNERLKSERNQLQEENRALRRELTESRLLNYLEESISNVDEEEDSMQTLPPLAERLYQALPPSFSFPVYFKVAENEDLEMDAARRFLRHFLAKEQVVREGSRLRKQPSVAGRTQGGDGQPPLYE